MSTMPLPSFTAATVTPRHMKPQDRQRPPRCSRLGGSGPRCRRPRPEIALAHAAHSHAPPAARRDCRILYSLSHFRAWQPASLWSGLRYGRTASLRHSGALPSPTPERERSVALRGSCCPQLTTIQAEGFSYVFSFRARPACSRRDRNSVRHDRTRPPPTKATRNSSPSRRARCHAARPIPARSRSLRLSAAKISRSISIGSPPMSR